MRPEDYEHETRAKATRYVIREGIANSYRVSYHRDGRDGTCMSILVARDMASAVAEFLDMASAYGWNVAELATRDADGNWTEVIRSTPRRAFREGRICDGQEARRGE